MQIKQEKPILDKIRETDYQYNNYDIIRCGRTLDINITYPSVDDKRVKYIEINQESVRASDGIRLFYDYDRDGWVIQAPTKLSWHRDDKDCDYGWEEVAYVESWQLEDKQKAYEESILTQDEQNQPK